MKLNSSAVGLIPLLIAVLTTNGIVGVKDDNIQDYVEKTPSKVANFINDNFSTFVDEYNKVSNQEWKATSIENQFAITIDTIDERYDGVFLDFNDQNGYAVVGKEYNFLDFSIDGESPYKDISADSFYYSAALGYLYEIDGEYQNVDTNKDTPDSFFDDLSFGTTYSGQQEGASGCGHIEDPSLYVNSRYDNGWSLYKNKSLSMATENNTQSYLSCYYEHFYKGNDAYYSTEGSCWFVSAYNVLQSIADATGSYKTAVNKLKTDSNKDSMPKKNELETYVPCESEPSLYRQVYDENGNNITKKVYSSDGKNWMYSKTLVAKSRNFPKLYNVVRNYVVNTYGKVDGGTVYDTASIINNIGSKYGYSFKARGTVLAGLYGSSGFTAIDKNLPFVLCTATVSNAGYGDHLMAGCGYKIYKKTSGWWIFKFTSYKYFYELRDGHNNQPMYIDMSALCGFGGIVLLDYGFFKY